MSQRRFSGRSAQRWLAGLLCLLAVSSILALVSSAGPSSAAASWTLALEAEEGAVQAPMTIRDDPTASACAYVASDLGENGVVVLTFSLDSSRVVYPWGRTRAPHEGANSFFISVDNEPERRWDFPVGSTWSWNAMRDARTGARLGYALNAGPHTLRVRTREGGSPLDGVILSEDAWTTPAYVAPCGPTATPTITPTPTASFTPTLTPTLGPTASATATPAVTATSTHTATPPAAKDFLYVEAEAGQIQTPMALLTDPSASACAYIASPEGNIGTSTITFELTEPGVYGLWGRTRAPHSGANSLYIAVDSGAEFRWDFPVTSVWTWYPMKDAYTGAQPFFSLSAGAHTVRVRSREGSSPLDVVALGTDRTKTPAYALPCGPTPTPTITLSPTSSATPAHTATATHTFTPGPSPVATATPSPSPAPAGDILYLEAEDGLLEAPMLIAEDRDASACRYVYSTSGNAGLTTLTFTVAEPGNYFLWGRTRADHSGMNSLFVTVDNGPETRWDFPLQTAWTWNPVKDAYSGARKVYSLSAGAHQVRVRAREKDSPLDVLGLSKDGLQVPAYRAGCGPATSTPTATHTATFTITPTPSLTKTPTQTPTIGPSPTPTDTPAAVPTPTPYGVVRVEPEEARTLVAPMVIGDDPSASRCRYVYSPRGNDSAGYFVTPFEVPMAGYYQIWGRVRTPDVGSNAFFVSVDAETEFQWFPPVYTDWSWTKVTKYEAGSVVPTYFLTAGVHYIWVRTREAGSQLDALEFVYVGPGRSYTPSYVAPCGPATPTPTPTPTFTVTPPPTDVPYTETRVLQQGVDGYAGVVDTYIDYDNPSSNFHTSSSLYLEGFDKGQILIRYDLSALPSSARVVSATLGMYVVPDARFERRQPFTSTVYALTREWEASGATWMEASAGEPWGVPGAYDPSSDYAPWPNDEIWFYESTPQALFTERWFTYTVTSLVQEWIEHPEQNKGFVIKSHWPHEITYLIRSSNFWSPAFRPRLHIIYYPGDRQADISAGGTAEHR